MEFKVGDTFKFRKGLVKAKFYGPLSYNPSMEKDNCTIEEISARGMYRLMNNWFVTKEMSIPTIKNV